MGLNVEGIKAANAREKDYKLYDYDGLYLIVTKKGHKWWRFKYRIGGKEKLLALGTFPEVSLAKARLDRNDARKLVAAGTDPSSARKEARVDAPAAVKSPTLSSTATAWIHYHRANK